jgi:hypothetical protein
MSLFGEYGSPPVQDDWRRELLALRRAHSGARELAAAPGRRLRPVPDSLVLLVLADDLIWASRLAAAAHRVGATVRRASTLPEDLPAGGSALVDLGGHRYDAIESVARLSRSGINVAGVCNHEDVALRRRALDAGASQVWSYNRFHREGPRLLERWLGLAVAS